MPSQLSSLHMPTLGATVIILVVALVLYHVIFVKR